MKVKKTERQGICFLFGLFFWSKLSGFLSLSKKKAMIICFSFQYTHRITIQAIVMI